MLRICVSKIEVKENENHDQNVLLIDAVLAFHDTSIWPSGLWFDLGYCS